MPAIAIDVLEKLLQQGDYVHIHSDGSVTVGTRGGLKQQLEDAIASKADLEHQLGELRTLLNTPEIEDFDKAVPLEAAHQVQRWGSQHDAGKKPEDWFWLIGYLAGKALRAHLEGDEEKAKHHCISTAAALRNWHAHIRSGSSAMRPGLSAEATASVDSTNEVKP